jgi:multicomponent Na+:H+ antiporter subunit C
MTALAYGVAGWLVLVGLYGVVTSRHLVHLVICLSIVQSATVLLLVTIGYRSGAAAPVLTDIGRGHRVTDPVVQAMTLTDVVVEAGVTALLLTLAVQAHRRFGTVDPDELREMQG